MKLLISNFLQYPVTSLLDSNIVLSTLSSNTFNSRISVRVRDQILYPYNKTGKHNARFEVPAVVIM
jgi:hypothetical protein